MLTRGKFGWKRSVCVIFSAQFNSASLATQIPREKNHSEILAIATIEILQSVFPLESHSHQANLNSLFSSSGSCLPLIKCSYPSVVILKVIYLSLSPCIVTYIFQLQPEVELAVVGVDHGVRGHVLHHVVALTVLLSLQPNSYKSE